MAWQKITINKEVVKRFTADELGNMYCTYSSASGTVNGAGILKRLAGSQEWVDITPRGQIVDTWTNVEDIKYANGVLLVTMRSSRNFGNIIRSTDKGVTWTRCPLVYDATEQRYDPFHLEYLGNSKWACSVISMEHSYYISVLRSDDNGLNWYAVRLDNIQGWSGATYGIAKASNNRLYVSTANSIYNSGINNYDGFEWQKQEIPYPAVDIKDIDSELYLTLSSALFGYEKVVKTQYLGATAVDFSNFTITNNIEAVYGIIKIAENTFICTTGSSTGDGDIWKTENNGTTWVKEEMGAQYEYFMYPYLYNNEVYAGSGRDAGDGAIWILSLDSEPPSFNSVSIDTITYNSANLNVNSNETGTVYYKILPRNTTAPTSAELKANPDGQTNVTANITSIISLTRLTSNANLDCYVVAEDTVPNLQLEPTKIQFTTPPAPMGVVITSTDKSYKTSINSTSMRFVVKPNTKYTFGLQAIRTTKEGIIATNIIQNEVITTPNKSNFKGVVQVTDDANYLYQKTTLRLGQNALGTNDDGLYVGNTAIGDNPTNFMKFSTTNGTFDLKSTGNIRFTNGSSNELFFDSGTTTNSFLKMNSGSQQLGLCSDSGGSYQGLFVGDTKLDDGKYFKYDGTELTVGKNVNFNWIDTLSLDATKSLQYLMNKTIDQMLKGTTTYTDNLITVRSGLGVGNEKAYFGNMSTISNGFGLKIDSDANNYFYANTVDGVKFKTNKNVNIKNTTNEINFDSTTSNNSFISMNGGSQQIGRVNLTNMSATFDKITGNVGNYTLSASGINLTGVFSIGDSVKISQSGKVNTLGKITNISFLGSTTITIDSILLDNYTSAYIYKLGFNGFYIGNTNLLTGNEFYKDSLGLNFSGKYFNKTAYCNDSIEFLGALDTSKSIVKNVINPFFGKIVNDIVLTNKDDFNIQLEFLNYTSALILDYANLASFPTSLYGTPTKFRALDTGIIYIQDYIDGDVTPSYKIYNINTLQYRGTYLTENDSFLFSALSTINGIDFVSKYYAIPLGKSRYKISTDLLGATSTTLSEGVAVISLINPAYSVGAIDLHFGQLSYIVPSSDIKSIKSIHSSDECTIDFCSVWDGHSNYGSGLLLNNEIIIENVRFKNIGSKDLYNGTYYSILLQSSDIHLNNINILNLKSEFSCNNSISSTIKNIRIENYDSSLIAGLTNFVNADNITLVATKSLGVSNSNLIYNGLNIKNLIITTPLNINKNLTISPSANGFIQGIDNISNIHIDGNLYSTLFYQCNNITNINIINNIIDNTSISNYYFKECTCITNGRVYYASHIPNNIFLKDCSYITNFSGISINQTSGLINDVNNSWNITSSIRTLVADSTIVRYTWTYFDIELIPQKFKIVLHAAQTGAAINTEIAVTEALTSLIIELEMYDDGGTLRVRPISTANTGDEVFVKFTATQLGIRNDINGIGRVVIISETF